jgi:MarR family transcriptional regulator, organic hydroperoxide resistance regulator
VTGARVSETATSASADGGAASELGASLARAERTVTRRLSRLLEQDGIGIEAWRVLCLLADGQGHPMAQVAEAALVPAPSLTRLADRLVADNLVYRRADDRDRRRVLVYATERGLALQRRLAARVELAADGILAAATPRDVARIIALLDRLE